ncbi:division plane positioning ATPase MipZ [Ferruginivarius sediminum]|uniref:division plane positioning ATPase MipZ n=1 Tax=Ferruginivarius sediminum TaxID=2661937 RepID=UPI00137AC40A|nr:division plane positioning ATPase MipZ [Ferruginivarius sediminum]
MRVITVTAAEADTETGPIADLLADAARRMEPPLSCTRLEAPHDGGTDTLIETIRRQDADLCVVDARSEAFAGQAALAGASDFAIVAIDGARTGALDIGGALDACASTGTEFAFVICNTPVEDIDTDLVLGLVQHGTVAPGSLRATTATPEARQDALELLRYLDDRVQPLERYLGDPQVAREPEPAERRAFRRWSIEWPIRVATSDGYQAVSLTDISGSGIGFSTNLRFKTGEAVDIEIAGLGTFKSQIVWQGGQQVGARFHLSSENAEALAAEIQKTVDERRRQWFDARRRRAGTVASTGTGQQNKPPPGPAIYQGNRAPVVVVINSKGGTGKSTIAVHLAVALLADGHKVATMDLDREQGTFTDFIRARKSRANADALTTPTAHFGGAESPAGNFEAFLDDQADAGCYVVIDTPGQRFDEIGCVLRRADHIVIPINDSFLDLAVLDSPDSGTSAKPLLPALLRENAQTSRTIWIVRNRLSPLYSRNKARIADAVAQLSESYGIRIGDGMSERVIYRELYNDGLTVFDIGQTGKTKLTMSHLSARQEIRSLARMMRKTGAQSRAPEKRIA